MEGRIGVQVEEGTKVIDSDLIAVNGKDVKILLLVWAALLIMWAVIFLLGQLAS